MRFWAPVHLRHKAVPIMVQLRDELNETVVLAQRRGNHILNLDKVVCRQGIIEAPIIGVWTLLHESPAGLAVLSTFGEQELESYLTDVGARHRLPPALRNQIGNAKTAIVDPARTASAKRRCGGPNHRPYRRGNRSPVDCDSVWTDGAWFGRTMSAKADMGLTAIAGVTRTAVPSGPTSE